MGLMKSLNDSRWLCDLDRDDFFPRCFNLENEDEALAFQGLFFLIFLPSQVVSPLPRRGSVFLVVGVFFKGYILFFWRFLVPGARRKFRVERIVFSLAHWSHFAPPSLVGLCSSRVAIMSQSGIPAGGCSPRAARGGSTRGEVQGGSRRRGE